jgi:hypothetical protein
MNRIIIAAIAMTLSANATAWQSQWGTVPGFTPGGTIIQDERYQNQYGGDSNWTNVHRRNSWGQEERRPTLSISPSGDVYQHNQYGRRDLRPSWSIR